MTKKKKILIILGIILIILLVFAIIITVVVLNSNKQEEEASGQENVKVLDNGTKLNTSKKLAETKTIDGLEISGLQLTESGNVTQLLGTIKNTTNETKGGYIITAKLVDIDGNELTTISPYIKELQPGETTLLNASTVFDYSNAYDVILSK